MWDWSKGLHQAQASPRSHIDSGPSRVVLLRVPCSPPALLTPSPSPRRSRCSCRCDRCSPPSSPPAGLPACVAQPTRPASRPVSELPPSRPRRTHLQAGLRFGSCESFWPYLHVGPTTFPARRGDSHLPCFNLCNRDAAPGRGGEGRVNWRVRRGLGPG